MCLALGGCGGASDSEGRHGGTPAAASSTDGSAEPKPEPGFDPDDPALNTIPESDASRQALIERIGNRRDFKVPRRVVAGLRDGPLVLAVVVRSFMELEADDPGVRRLNDGQRAVYAMYVADFEILNGGFEQLWHNTSGAIAQDLVHAAERVGSREFAGIFRDAAALWPSGTIPRDHTRRQQSLGGISTEALATVDERYAATQYRRKTALALVLGRYIRGHPDQFLAG
ncbi:MAG: hypothetical protein JWN65_1303 [Solirubrobacterales bacterium]|nr:hypothetical protein [Solirubrobacterales bacterium]